MQAKELIDIMKGKTPFNKDTLSDLSELIEQYPYFQTAHLLHTLNLQANRDTRFPARVAETACYINDRRKFFYWVEKDFFSSSLIKLMEKKEDSTLDTPFDLVDFFLSEKGGKAKKELSSQINTSDQLASTDYMSYLLSDETVSQESLEVTPMQHQDTIDKFLSENEKAPVKIHLDDLEDKKEVPDFDLDEVPEDSFFSETLAKIYLKQKKYEKALEIIRKLNLIYPEKSIYFADQIRFLEKVIINANKIK